MPEIKIPLKGLFYDYDSVVVFDVETSGLNPYKDQIIQLAFTKLNLVDENLKKLNVNAYVHLYAGHTISEEAYAVHHVTESLLRTHGISINGIISQLVSLTKEERCLFIAYNAAFDAAFLHAAMKYCGYDRYFNQINMLDALTIFKDRHPYPHKLSDAIKVYGLSGIVKNSHSAVDDVDALIYILTAMAREKSDLEKYVNLFGYNPKYPPVVRLPKYRYVAQPYDAKIPLYIKCLPQFFVCPDCHGMVDSRVKYCPHCGCPIEFVLGGRVEADPLVGATIRHLKLGTGTVKSTTDNTITVNFGNGDVALTIGAFFGTCIFQDKKIRDIFLQKYNEAIRRTAPTPNYEIYEYNRGEYYDDLEDTGPAEESYEYYFGDDEVLDDGELY